MKSLFKYFLSSLLIFLNASAFAYILSPQTILQKLIENNGTGVFQIEQELVFPNGADSVVLKEVWQIKDQDTLRLTVYGTRELKDQIKWSFIYYNGQKVSVGPQGKKIDKIPSEFFERFFHFRKSEAFYSALITEQIVSPEAFQRKVAVRTIAPNPKEKDKDKDKNKEPEKEWIYPQDPQLRFARVGGTITYALGTPSSSEQDKPNPGLWIDQDAFAIRKLRLASQTEVVVEKSNTYSRGLVYPKTRSVRWGDNQIQINTINAIGIADKGGLFSSTTLEPVKSSPVFESLPNKKVIDEFYSRFR